MPAPPNIDPYMAALPEEVRPVLARVRVAIRKAIPKADESISYGIPTYKIGGHAVIYFAAWKKHYSLYPVNARLRETLGEAIAGYQMSKGTLKFPYSDVKVALIQKIARLRAKETA